MHSNNQTKPTAVCGGRKFKNDLIFIAAILAVVAILALVLLLRGEGTTVRVELDGREIGSYSLAVDREVEILSGENGEEKNLLVIRGGKAYVSSATCPDGICASHRPISRVGESIVCLPHGVVILVVGEEKDQQPDIIV